MLVDSLTGARKNRTEIVGQRLGEFNELIGREPVVGFVHRFRVSESNRAPLPVPGHFHSLKRKIFEKLQTGAQFLYLRFRYRELRELCEYAFSNCPDG